jgi:acyl-CoA-dependent ceramide synthase
MLRYLGFTTLCDWAFGIFLLTWVITRHVFFPKIILSVAFEAPKYVSYSWKPEAGLFWTRTTHCVLVGLMVGLQVLVCIWFYMICKVAWKIVTGSANAEDTRSDSE